jgi:2OG-Fe(II) oxygenase superfamily
LNSMKRIQHFSLHTTLLCHFQTLNRQLLEGLTRHIDDETTRKTHLFFGRYENIYISRDQIPQIDDILGSVIEAAAKILKRPSNELKAGLWFNVMNPGDKTTLHKHDDDDELLSAVYYVKVPDNSGTLVIGKEPAFTRLTPQEGLLALFPPNMPHEVTENLSSESRISLGINIGPLRPEA